MILELNSALDRAALAREFSIGKRIQVHNYLTPQSAERLFTCLSSETQWRLVYYDGEKPVQLTQAQLKAMTPARQAGLEREILERARNDYQYVYYTYPILETYKAGQDSGHFLHRYLEFVNSEPVLELIRAITGIPEILKGDGQATLFERGQFLKLHVDEDIGEGWRAAYVLNLTKTWQRDWGGLLQFFDATGNVEVAFLPAFNVLNMFAVPQDHSVSYVTPFAAGPRYSITGWFRDK